jgi:hypothetical protein
MPMSLKFADIKMYVLKITFNALGRHKQRHKAEITQSHTRHVMPVGSARALSYVENKLHITHHPIARLS